MNGSGCKNCPVKHCDTLTYRGSRCASLRDKFGLGDPKTNADHIRSMTDEELEEGIRAISLGSDPWCDHHCEMRGDDNCNICLANWLKQPYK